MPLAASCSDLGVNLPHGELVGAASLGSLLDGFQPIRRRRHGIHVVFEAHDDDLGLSPAFDEKTLVPLGRPLQNLPELGAGGEGGNDVLSPFLKFLNGGYLRNELK